MTKSKKRIILEYELNTTSPSSVWPLISEAGCLERWMADSVERSGKKLKFTWGNTYMNKDEKTATVTKEIKDQLIRFRWDDEEDPDAYCELKIETGEITNDCLLAITDFADEDDEDSLREIWDDNIQALHQSTGV